VDPSQLIGVNGDALYLASVPQAACPWQAAAATTAEPAGWGEGLDRGADAGPGNHRGTQPAPRRAEAYGPPIAVTA
jgi:hypothetical protein